jgi:aspartate/methionine/tyrosine aminotransferase
MTDILLAKPQLSADWKDCSIGEAHVVRHALRSIFDISACDLPKDNFIFEYQEPRGYKPLVQLLEEKYQSPVVICNGAKQGMGAAFFALKQMGKNKVYLPRPWWALIPPLMEMHSLKSSHEEDDCDSYFCVAPNNPCGSMPDLQSLSFTAKYCNKPFIHDAVYYNNIYLPNCSQFEQFGDVQIYSSSKSFGLSSLRVGWVVCPNTEMYKLILHYMEHMTVGVSIVSQIFLYNLLNRMHGYPTLTEKFESLAAAALQESKKIIQKVDPKILEINSNIQQQAGMFGFFKCHQPEAFSQAKINPAWGEHFGAPGYVRMNLAFDASTMEEIVSRLNSAIQ